MGGVDEDDCVAGVERGPKGQERCIAQIGVSWSVAGVQRDAVGA